MSPARRQNLSLLHGVSFRDDSDYHTWTFSAAGLCLLLIAGYSIFHVVEVVIEQEKEKERQQEVRLEEASLPRFAAMSDVASRKAAFFAFLEPYVHQANDDILAEREEILKLQRSYERNQGLSGSRLARLNETLRKYDLPPVEQASPRVFQRLLIRADTIPVSLALAQAALESGWGTSRFAQEGNNLFGMWCYEPGCGQVPRLRPAGRSYEVAAYDSPRESFHAYLRNLNTNSSYAELREIRSAHRARGLEPRGSDLAAGLLKYSEERWDYVEKVRNLISHNRLDG